MNIPMHVYGMKIYNDILVCMGTVLRLHQPVQRSGGNVYGSASARNPPLNNAATAAPNKQLEQSEHCISTSKRRHISYTEAYIQSNRLGIF